MPACGSVSRRHSAMSASLPGSSEPISASRPSTRAPPSVASSSASRTVIACGPPVGAGEQHRVADLADQRARLVGGRRRRRRARPARPRRSSARVRQIPAPSLALEDGQCATPVPVAASRRDGPSSRCTRVREPDVGAEPAERVQVLHRRAAEVLAAVLVLVGGLGQVRVQPDALVPGPASAASVEQVAGDRERRARGDADPQHRAGRRVVEPVDRVLGRGEDRVEVLDHVVGRQPARALAQVHRAAGGLEPQADLGAPPRSVAPSTSPPSAREHVVVVRGGRAAGRGQPGQRRRSRPSRTRSSSSRAQTG